MDKNIHVSFLSIPLSKSSCVLLYIAISHVTESSQHHGILYCFQWNSSNISSLILEGGGEYSIIATLHPKKKPCIVPWFSLHMFHNTLVTHITFFEMWKIHNVHLRPAQGNHCPTSLALPKMKLQHILLHIFKDAQTQNWTRDPGSMNQYLNTCSYWNPVLFLYLY